MPGIKHVVQIKFALGKESTENHVNYLYLLANFKMCVDQLAFLLINDIRVSNSIYPTREVLLSEDMALEVRL